MTTEPSQPKTPQTNRRDFMAATGAAAAGGALASNLIFPGGVHAAGDDVIRVVLLGCGGRGTGAVSQIFNSKGNVKLVAVADAFADKANGCLSRLRRQAESKVDVPPERVFDGLDGYKKAIDSGCDLVVIATPPGFKPQQFEYAVSQDKHIFMEKPVAVDAPGVRRVLAAVEESKKKNLMVGVGLQRRHEPRYMETIKRIHDGAIGEVILQRVYWNGGGIWYRPKYQNDNQMKFQVDNWYHFIWASGDQICEQHIHNLDVGCWVKGEYPVECNGMGGSQLRMGGDGKKSQIFDHTFCEYTFADGTKMYSQGRHAPGVWTQVNEFAHGTLGTSTPSGKIEGKNAWQFKGNSPGGHQQEQPDLIEALMAGKIYNEGEYGAKSTFTAILGREACYSGKVLKWDDLLKNGHNYTPGIDEYSWDTKPPAPKDGDGKYPV
ncbi:MAG: Gfo/Idh/MocA family oxidoreductase, partial [Planctomycetales bacterium]